MSKSTKCKNKNQMHQSCQQNKKNYKGNCSNEFLGMLTVSIYFAQYICNVCNSVFDDKIIGVVSLCIFIFLASYSLFIYKKYSKK